MINIHRERMMEGQQHAIVAEDPDQKNSDYVQQCSRSSKYWIAEKAELHHENELDSTYSPCS